MLCSLLLKISPSSNCEGHQPFPPKTPRWSIYIKTQNRVASIRQYMIPVALLPRALVTLCCACAPAQASTRRCCAPRPPTAERRIPSPWSLQARSWCDFRWKILLTTSVHPQANVPYFIITNNEASKDSWYSFKYAHSMISAQWSCF